MPLLLDSHRDHRDIRFLGFTASSIYTIVLETHSSFDQFKSAKDLGPPASQIPNRFRDIDRVRQSQNSPAPTTQPLKNLTHSRLWPR